MFSILSDAKKFLKLESVSTDNILFRLHYKVTLGLLAFSSMLLGAKQYFGEPIICQVSRAGTSIYKQGICILSS